MKHIAKYSCVSCVYSCKGLGLVLFLLLSCMQVRGQFQSVLFIYDPVRHTVVTTSNNASLKRFEKIGNIKKQLIYNKERTAANYMILNVIEEHLYNKEKSFSDGSLSRMLQLYEQSVDDIAQFWQQFENTYVLAGDTLRTKCEEYYKRAKENSDYEMGQIARRVDKYVRGSGYIANNSERISMMENCYERVKAEKARVIKHGRVLFSLAVYRESFKKQQIDVLDGIINK